MEVRSTALLTLFTLAAGCADFSPPRQRADAGLDADVEGGSEPPYGDSDAELPDAPPDDADEGAVPTPLPEAGIDDPETGPPVADPNWPTHCDEAAEPRALVLVDPAPRELVRLARPSGIDLMVVGPIAPLDGQVLWTFPSTGREDGVLLKPGAPGNNPIYALQDSAIGAPGDDETWGLRFAADGSANPTLTRTPEEIAANDALLLSPVALVQASKAGSDAQWAFVTEDNSTFTKAELSTWVASVRADDEPPLARESAGPVFGTQFGDFYTPLAALVDTREAGDGALYAFGCRLGMAGEDSFYPCILARVMPGDDPRVRASYTAFVRDPDGHEHWDADLTKATHVLDGSSTLSVSYNPHLGQFLAVHSVFATNIVSLKTAPTLSGPWTEATRVTLPAPPGGTGYDIFAREQIALSPNCGQRLVLSYLEATTYSSIFPTAGDTLLVTLELE